MNSFLVLSSIVRDITALARACERNNDDPDIEVVVSRDMRFVIGEAMHESGDSTFPAPVEMHQHQAKITTLWAADGCFAIVRLRQSVH